MRYLSQATLSVFLLALILSLFPRIGVADECRPNCVKPLPTKSADLSWLERKGHFDLNLGGGITYNSPVRLDVQLLGEYYVTNHVSVGLAFDTYIHTNPILIWRPTIRYNFNIESLPRFTPYVGGGVGAGIHTDEGFTWDIMVPDLGLKYSLSKHWLIGSDIGGHLFKDPSGYRLDLHFLFVVVTGRF